MNHVRVMSKSVLGAVALLLVAGQVSAKGQEWTEIDAEIGSCVAAVADHADYADATRVRHAVVSVKERVVGYKLTIETSLYNESGEAAIREYATSCVVNGNNTPLQFEISMTDNDA